jgi:hypothetical protein
LEDGYGTLRLIGVGICTLLAGVLGSAITAFVAARNSRAQRIEDRFVRKRVRLIDLVTDLLRICKAVDAVTDRAIKRQIYVDGKKNWDTKWKLQQMAEHFVILDSGSISQTALDLLLTDMNRLNALHDTSLAA